MRIHGYKLQRNNMDNSFISIRGINDSMKWDAIQTKMITDGVLTRKTMIEEKKIETESAKKEFSYASRVDRVIREEMTFSEASYLIQVLVVKKYLHTGHIMGFFDVIQDIDIYLKDIKDKQILKELRILIGTIINPKSSDYRSLFDVMVPRQQSLSKLATEEVEEGIYHVKKISMMDK